MIPFRQIFLFLGRFVIGGWSISLRFGFVVTGRSAVIVALRTFSLSLLPLFGLLLSLVIGLDGSWLFTSLGTVTAFFLFLVPVVVFIAVAAISLAAVSAFAVAVEAGQAFLLQQVYRLLGLGAVSFFDEAIRLDAAFIQSDNLECASAADGYQVGRNMLVG